jgi:hypothetical protein
VALSTALVEEPLGSGAAVFARVVASVGERSVGVPPPPGSSTMASAGPDETRVAVTAARNAASLTVRRADIETSCSWADAKRSR